MIIVFYLIRNWTSQGLKGPKRPREIYKMIIVSRQNRQPKLNQIQFTRFLHKLKLAFITFLGI